VQRLPVSRQLLDVVVDGVEQLTRWLAYGRSGNAGSVEAPQGPLGKARVLFRIYKPFDCGLSRLVIIGSCARHVHDDPISRVHTLPHHAVREFFRERGIAAHIEHEGGGAPPAHDFSQRDDAGLSPFNYDHADM
jgi:hypothetical protein